MHTIPVEGRPRVVATSKLADASAWYLMANPEIYPTIGRSRLENSPLSGVTFGSFENARIRDPESGKIETYPGLAMPATHTIGYNVLSRVGTCKFTKV
jgi:hypothetical protein